MNKGENLFCMCCMERMGSESACPVCGYSTDSAYDGKYRKPGSILTSRYIVGVLKSKNGEGATYIGFDSVTGQKVWVREYFPYTIARRDVETGVIMPSTGYGAQYKALMSDFIDVCNEVKRLSVSDPVVPIENVVAENNTVYAIYTMMDVVPFEDYLASRGGKLPLDMALELLLPFYNGVSNMHSRGGIHRGISPYTVYIDKSGKLYLGDFALSATRTVGSELTSELFNGYSAPEQYASTAWQGTWTDVYALGAMLYRTVSGIVPPKSIRITPQRVLPPLSDLVMDVTANISAAVKSAMQSDPQERTQTVSSFVAQLLETEASNTAVYDLNRISPAMSQAPAQTLPAVRNNQMEQPERVRLAEQPGMTKVKAKTQRSSERPPPARTGRRRVNDNSGGIAFRYILLALLITVGLLAGALTMFMNAYLPDMVKPKESSSSTRPVSVVTSSSESSGSGESSSQQEDKTVPGFIGRNIEDVLADKSYENRFIFRRVEEFDDSYEQGKIFNQAPSEGTNMPNKGMVVLYVSKGPSTVEMPDWTGKPIDEVMRDIYDMAKAEDRDLPFETFEIYAAGVQAGTVVRTTPPAGTKFNPAREKMEIFIAAAMPETSSSSSREERSSSSEQSRSTARPIDL